MRVAYELGATVVRPGQTLVLCTPHQMSTAEADQMKARLREKLPGVELVLLTGVTQALVYEPDEIRAADT
ncbi:hypothetical protein [Nonomuraea rosea]|uniref:hypothetical protein n=1 Tax=Nonomuraea rosea TaxID=638574 RepID=UPI0031EBD43F